MRTRKGRFLAFATAVLLAVSPLTEGFAASTVEIKEGGTETTADSAALLATNSNADLASTSDSTNLTDEETEDDADLASSSNSSTNLASSSDTYLADGEILNDLQEQTATPVNAKMMLAPLQVIESV